MRIAVLAATAMLAASAHAAQTDDYRSHSTAELVRLCSTPASASPTTRSRSPSATAFSRAPTATTELDAGVRAVCLRTGSAADTVQVAQDFVAWAKKNPQYMNDGGIDTLFRYAAQTYPCKR